MLQLLIIKNNLLLNKFFPVYIFSCRLAEFINWISQLKAFVGYTEF